jgi:hypothetical protein
MGGVLGAPIIATPLPRVQACSGNRTIRHVPVRAEPSRVESTGTYNAAGLAGSRAQGRSLAVV